MPKKYKSDVLRSVHLAMADLHEIGGVDKKTMRTFDRMCLTKVEAMSAGDIQALREREGVSQAVLAGHLNVRTKLVSDWERGVKKPSGPSLKLLAIVKAKGLDVIA
jgi:putative transcriptional regulator